MDYEIPDYEDYMNSREITEFITYRDNSGRGSDVTSLTGHTAFGAGIVYTPYIPLLRSTRRVTEPLNNWVQFHVGIKEDVNPSTDEERWLYRMGIDYAGS